MSMFEVTVCQINLSMNLEAQVPVTQPGDRGKEEVQVFCAN